MRYDVTVSSALILSFVSCTCLADTSLGMQLFHLSLLLCASITVHAVPVDPDSKQIIPVIREQFAFHMKNVRDQWCPDCVNLCMDPDFFPLRMNHYAQQAREAAVRTIVTKCCFR